MATEQFRADDLRTHTDRFGTEISRSEVALMREFAVALQRELMDVETALRVVSDSEADRLHDRRRELRADLEEVNDELRRLD